VGQQLTKHHHIEEATEMTTNSRWAKGALMLALAAAALVGCSAPAAQAPAPTVTVTAPTQQPAPSATTYRGPADARELAAAFGCTNYKAGKDPLPVVGTYGFCTLRGQSVGVALLGTPEAADALLRFWAGYGVPPQFVARHGAWLAVGDMTPKQMAAVYPQLQAALDSVAASR